MCTLALPVLSTERAHWPAETLKDCGQFPGLVCELYQATFLLHLQGHKVAELILHHARASECRDVEGFKAEMAALVTQARKNTITLEKVGRGSGCSLP